MSSQKKGHRSTFLKLKANELGFDFCGISKAEFLKEEAPRYDEWLKHNYQGEMSYLSKNFDKRLDPRKLVPGSESVISLIYNYNPQKSFQQNGSFKIAKYAYGKDYHKVIKKKMKQLVLALKQEFGDFHARIFVDSAPVHERAWAKKSGLGWVGKNSLLLNRKMGSFFFLAEIISDLEFEYDDKIIKDYCGSCTRCIDACPTDAIPAPYVIDGSRCISYLTIELKKEIPTNFTGKFEDWIFGCDICQDVCPWNRHSLPHNEPSFLPPEQLTILKKKDWVEMTEEIFNNLFEGSPLKRAKFRGLKRNIDFVKTGTRQMDTG